MDKVKINNQTYFFPSNWSEITLKVFLEIRDIEYKKDDMEFFDFAIKYINAVTSIPVEDLRNIKNEELSTVLEKLNVLSNSSINAVDHPIFKYNDKWYVFDTELTFGQFVDLNGITKDKEWWSIANEISSVFIRPAKIKFSGKLKLARRKPLEVKDFIVDKYDYLSLKDRAEIFMNYLPMDQIYTCKAFFLTLKKNLEETIPSYSQAPESTQKNNTKRKKIRK